MLPKNANLFLFTAEFPYGRSEFSFLATEIKFLAEQFAVIYLIPLRIVGTVVLTELPENVKIVEMNLSASARRKSLASYVQAFGLITQEIFGTGNFRILKNIRYHVSQSLNYFYQAEELNGQLRTLINFDQDVFYTYWFDEGTTIVCLLKKRIKFVNKIVSRAHGFDLYDYRNNLGYIFPRNFQLKNVQAVFSISKDGEAYLKNKFSNHKDKIHYSPLGTLREGNQLRTEGSEREIRIVSCSSLIPLKRIHLIIKILSCSSKKIQWVHFGNGPLEAELKEQTRVLPDNVVAVFKGQTENSDIKKYYEENYISWFINVSEYEGIPVSIMEAISFGIPIIATNVGGTKEIVNDTTGVLIEKEFEPSNIVHLIEDRVFATEQRIAIKEFWNKNYNAATNYRAFAKLLRELN